MRRALPLLLVALPAFAFEDPALDDFYARGAARAEGPVRQTEAGRRYILNLLVGAVFADLSEDPLAPVYNEGLRLGLDGGLYLNRWSVTRTRLYADLLHALDRDVESQAYALQHTTFYSTAERRYDEALHLSLDAVAARRVAWTRRDFAELRMEPYRVADVEGEAAIIAGKIDKGGNLAIPVGWRHAHRWSDDDQVIEDRDTLSAAVALRGFPRLLDTPEADKRRHYQLDFLRLTRAAWRDAESWRLSAGYQRLSPGIPGFEIWLLLGYGWHEAPAAERAGLITQAGVRQQVGDAHGVGLSFDRWFALDAHDGRFRRSLDARLSYDYAAGGLSGGFSYGYAEVEGRGALHDLIGRLGWHPAWAWGFGLGARYRLAKRVEAVEGEPEAPDQLLFSLDWLY